MSQDRWAKLDKGQFEIKEMQCERCINKFQNPMVYTEFPDRKTSYVLKLKLIVQNLNLKNRLNEKSELSVYTRTSQL